ncbi:MAG: TonB-dependent receptor, partial [bacterium]|nr:TonB-dependent receptor [bacterium]
FSGTPSIVTNRPADNWQLKGTYTKVMGNHTLKIGGDFMKATMRRQQASHGVTYTRFDTADLAQSATTGDSVASMLLNVANDSSRRDILETLRFGGNIGLFAQDSWKVSQKLTVNLGLRFDYAWVPQYGTVEDGNIFTGNANTDTGQYAVLKTPPSCAQAGAAPCIPTPDGSLPDHVISLDGGTLISGRGPMWGPRLGLAYRLTDKTALRASAGITYDNWAGIYQSARGV